MTWDKLAGMTPEEIQKRRRRSRTRRCRTRCTPTAGRSSRRCRSRCSRGSSGSTSTSTCPRRSCPSSRRRSSSRTGRSWATSRAGEVVSHQQLPRAVQGHPDAGAARRPAAAADAAAAGGVQPDRRPQERRSRSLGVACFDCHVNGHTTGQFHLSPDIRPQERRFRLDTTSLRGVFNQQIHGSQAEPALGRGLHRVRAADGLLQRRPDPADEEGVPGACRGA